MTAASPARTPRPCGSWPSPITAEATLGGGARVGEVRVDGDDIWWSEQRPAEGGRTALVRRAADGSVHEVLPPVDVASPAGGPWNARSQVHEYGGGAWWVRDGAVVLSQWTDQRLWRWSPGAVEPVALTPEPGRPRGLRYADADGLGEGWLVCVRESHERDGEAVNEVVALPLDGSAAVDPEQVVVLASGSDFVASPRVSPEGTWLAWLRWDHPRMPWDGTELCVAPLRMVDGRPALGEANVVSGGPAESVVQPTWVDEGTLLACSDGANPANLGWWNPIRIHPHPRDHDSHRTGLPIGGPGDGSVDQFGVGGAAAGVEPVTSIEAEIGGPHWVFGGRWFAPLPDGRLVASATADGLTGLVVVEVHGEVRPLVTPFTEVAQVLAAPDGAGVVVVAGTPTDEPAVWRVDLADGSVERLSAEPDRPFGPEWISTPEPIRFPTVGGDTAYGLLYRPTNPECAVPEGERPPLIVMIHGGPTSAARPSLSLAKQLWTSRGFAVVDVNHRGSTGYGRDFRDALQGRWGVADVEDCAAAATYLADEGLVDRERLAIRGGSAGGFTTLAALTSTDVFAAGASHYGIADLAALATDTHKFESRYTDGLVAPWPEGEATYAERSPIHHTDRLTKPLLVLQGLEDEVVPPNQAEAIVAALAAKGVPHAYLPFAGEQHGWRRAETIVRALEAELWFYGRVFRFTPADAVEPVPGAVGL